ncbi:glutamate dehydrogenase [Sinobacterium caligoides]|uniref:Glutamate dehydrogenase n=1 Tax=Sinobacterium caligoides TaxID=933926 RepID=A0A3N2DZY2_9GAMM|nr:NAD-glutamate dehydrogenase [Sinobacterium caligoides]ROS04999.1 glutamate dehydrogenase [Sinobacterium caligoides]
MVLTDDKRKFVAVLEEEIKRRVTAEESEKVADFARHFLANFPVEELESREINDSYGTIYSWWRSIQQVSLNTPTISVFNPEFEKDGWQSKRTIVSIISRDMPFLLDSVRLELNRRNIVIHTIHSFVINAHRDDDEQLLGLVSPDSEEKGRKEALLYLEIAKHSDVIEIAALVETIKEILGEVECVVDDWPTMTTHIEAVAEQLDSQIAGASSSDQKEVQLFLKWMASNHFTFLGYEELAVNYEGGKVLVEQVKDSALGLTKLRGSMGSYELYNELTSSAVSPSCLEGILTFSKSSVRSRVHRLVYPDYVGLKRFDEEGRVIGEYRFLGLYTSNVYTISPRQIPVIRRKTAAVLARSGLDVKSHDGRELLRVLETYPRDELFQSRTEELYHTAIQINHIQERRIVRLFMRRDKFGKFVTAMVYTPRDIYNTNLRERIEKTICDALNAQESEFTTYFSESILARTHIVFRVGTDALDFDVKKLEHDLMRVTKEWTEQLREVLIDEFGEERGTAIAGEYANAFPLGYQEDFSVRTAIADIRKVQSLKKIGDIEMSFYRVMEERDNMLRFRLVNFHEPLALSDMLPIMENLGLRVVSERPYGITRRDGEKVWIHDFSLIYSLSDSLDVDSVKEKFQEAFFSIWQNRAESDSFNKLLLGTMLSWRDIALLRAYARYMKQVAFSFSESYIADTLCSHLDITRDIVRLFKVSFDPGLRLSSEQRATKQDIVTRRIIAALDDVHSLSEDRVIRHYLDLIQATLRTNYFQLDANESLKSYFSFKFNTQAIPEVPEPRPEFEIFVYSPRVEGVHLRGGKVARGGLRWSDRYEDFRTEVLGLVKAQQVKNAVIVPVGAKGGFVAKNLPLNGSREDMQAEGIACYRIFIQGLLDITDNIVDGSVVPPKKTIRKDEDDVYLVVAADKGTATFSDIANDIAKSYNFWLGDAFASGGSIGYDHKKMGITARGAWVSVQRHFREMGIDVQSTEFTAIGIGDMAGDVFGNGMLLSEHILLKAAFNHQHIFIDPNPVAATSFAERKRLFDMPRSSWADYDESLISEGGGVFSRQAKFVRISEQIKAVFGIHQDRLTPNELLTILLKAEVDLIWNGGIGTYAKASTESHADVGDKANDVLRVDGRDLRCKVIGEGGNLGFTQLARVEYGLKGGRSNTDFIDNAGGVDCSDHEVNIKILLNSIVANGDMTEKQRVQLLEEMTESIAESVLQNNYRQVQALSLAERQVLQRSAEYSRYINQLEAEGQVDRQLEFLPDDELQMERLAQGKGLTRPELSVLISYSKSILKAELATSNIPDDPYLAGSIESAFPARLLEQYRDNMYNHSLRKEIIATQVANDVVNTMGITFVHKLVQSTAADSCDVARAYMTAKAIFRLDEVREQIEALDHQVDADVQMQMLDMMMGMMRRACRWFVRNRRSLIKPEQEIGIFAEGVRALSVDIHKYLQGSLEDVWGISTQYFIDKGVPVELANYVAATPMLYSCLGIIEAAGRTEMSLETVAKTYFAAGEQLELPWFTQRLLALSSDNHWQALAREALLDDVEWQMRTITVGIINHCGERCANADEAVKGWMETQSAQVERWHATMTELHATVNQEFAMYSVAIRELLDLAQSASHSKDC